MAHLRHGQGRRRAAAQVHARHARPATERLQVQADLALQHGRVVRSLQWGQLVVDSLREIAIAADRGAVGNVDVEADRFVERTVLAALM
ncbi:hypothetical protein D9M70_558540 [compost metagenome]